MSAGHTGFFAVGRDTFIKACELGVTEAAVFLVLARGSGGDNVTTNWSAQAAQTRLHVRWSRADSALKALIRSRLVQRVRDSTRPSYKIAKKGDLIWLPNSLVDGAVDEIAPVARVRQCQDAMALRLLVDLYSAQNLREDGGVSTSVVRCEYEREAIGQRGLWTIWAFRESVQSVTWTQLSRPHYRPQEELTEEEIMAGKNPGVDFFQRFKVLTNLGLVQWVPYLFEGPEGEPIHPLWEASDIPEERTLALACEAAAQRCLTDGQIHYAFEELGADILAPAPSHILKATLKGVARLRYRPHTAMTSAWWADTITSCRQYAEQYSEVYPRLGYERETA